MFKAAWMWGDAGEGVLAGHGLAKRDPFHWSAEMNIEDAIRNLEEERSANPGRPVKVTLQVDSKLMDSDGLERKSSELQQAFTDLDTAIAGLKDCQSISEDANAGNTSGPEGETVSLARQTFLTHLTGQSIASVRWMWADAGWAAAIPLLRRLATDNPLNWSQWFALEEAILDLGSFEYTGASHQLERPVYLQIKSSSPEGASVRYETRVEKVTEAAVLLEELLDITTVLKDRGDFSTEDDAENAYQEYAVNKMQENGGCVGAAVRFSSMEAHPVIQHGQQGVIQKFGNAGSFVVNWGAQSGSVGMKECTLLATADGCFHLAGVSADGILLSLLRMGNERLKDVSSDPSAFEGTFKQLVECYSHPRCNYRAVEVGMCETVVRAMAEDAEKEGGPNRSLQYTCCMMLWWIIRPRASCHRGGVGQRKLQEQKETKLAEIANSRALDAGVFSALVKTRQAFPHDKELSSSANDVVCYLIKDSAEHREKVLAAGWKEEWLSP